MRRLETYSYNAQDSENMHKNAGNLYITHTIYIESNKMNPFELRFNIFNVAKDILVKQHEANLAIWEALDKTSKKTQDLAPKYPTVEDIVNQAIEINKFISETSVNEFTKVAKRLTSAAVIF